MPLARDDFAINPWDNKEMRDMRTGTLRNWK